MNVERKRGRGKPKRRWLDTIENDMRAVSGCVGYVENRDEGEEKDIIEIFRKI